MKRSLWPRLTAVLVAALAAEAGAAQEAISGAAGERAASLLKHAAEREALQVHGTLGIYAKYNSNLDLNNEGESGAELKESAISEPSATVRISRAWASHWWIDFEWSSLANWHQAHERENWYFNRGLFSVGRSFGSHSIALSNEIRYFTTPGLDDFDFVRNSALLSYENALSSHWKFRTGYENIATHYPQSPSFDYSVNGFFAEFRTVWNLNLSTYYSYDFQRYKGTFDPRENNPNSSPEEGSRYTGKIGFDWVFAGAQALSGVYMLQSDSSEMGGSRIGDFEGREDSQDSESEFDVLKHKASLLYSYHFSRRLTLSSYAEWIYKNFDSGKNFRSTADERRDILFLSSTYIKLGLSRDLGLKFRYLFRTNHSSFDDEDYQDHILFVGPEYRF